MYKPAMERGAAAVANANADVLVVVDALYYGRDLTRAGDANGTVEVPETRESRKFDRFQSRKIPATVPPSRRTVQFGGSGRGAPGVRGARLLVVRHAG